ncbi:hypothetical protein [Paraliomyxa miuraensis]|uniref:hypothetical protein n=1 Tax=Paraliomyxa miuraensis TaxID=376150 RepID=UPI0022593630|nr:hypothetical protein [Paraliomyxa miuraensis]MCX4241631.1 hypothetical protein [Paraliomyxa miuraensis]
MTLTFGSRLVNGLAQGLWGLAALAMAMTMEGCVVGGDDGTNTTVVDSGPVPTTGMTATDGTTAEESTSSATTMPAEETADPDTSGGVTCDPPCPAGQMCIEGACFDIPPEETTTGEPPPPTDSDYGPCNMCAAGESPVQIMGLDGCFCSPPCDGAGSMCAMPNEGTAQPMCVLELMMGAGPTQCALICMDDTNCPAGATCQAAGGAGICVHPAP